MQAISEPVRMVERYQVRGDQRLRRGQSDPALAELNEVEVRAPVLVAGLYVARTASGQRASHARRSISAAPPSALGTTREPRTFVASLPFGLDHFDREEHTPGRRSPPTDTAIGSDPKCGHGDVTTSRLRRRVGEPRPPPDTASRTCQSPPGTPGKGTQSAHTPDAYPLAEGRCR